MEPIQPRIFIGSSQEGKTFALALQRNLSADHIVTVWDQDIFRLGKSNLENLVEMLDGFDFAVFVFSPDDKVILRQRALVMPRDNVFFECGLFMGRLGRERSLFVRPSNLPSLRIPSDLLGVTGITFNHLRGDKNWTAELAPAAEQIRNHIRRIWIDSGFELSRYLITALSKPQNPKQWLTRVMQSGYFCGIDDGFWLGLCERMKTSDRSQIADRARQMAEVRDSQEAVIAPADVYALMQVLFERVVKRAQRYRAVATELDLTKATDDSASEQFLFDAPNRFPESVWRLFLIPDLGMLQRLKPEMKRDLISQIERGVTLRVLQKAPGPKDNFGIYGEMAVGTLDQKTQWNRVNFDRAEVNRRGEDFLALWQRACPLRREMLSTDG